VYLELEACVTQPLCLLMGSTQALEW